MENIILTKKEETVAQATQLISGLEQHEATADVKQNTKLVLIAALANAVNAKTAYDTAVTARTALSTALSVADENVKAFIGFARMVLLYFIGALWSEAWMSTGFQDQCTAVPRVSSLREVLMGALKTYFAANPTHEVPALNVTAAAAEALKTALLNARAAYTAAVADCYAKRVTRDAAFTELRKRMRGLVDELGTVLSDTDSRWLAFGLNIPGAEATPDGVDHVTVMLIGPTTAALKWPAPARAQFYHVFRRIVGVDAEQVLVGSPADIDFNMEELPAHSSIEISVSAVNDGGEGHRSPVVTIVTP
ncbi:MAG: hypothetical protein JWM68_3841 [Verrucomicrobiales bacterium]|nr:hypothetical protein [Verrucomicrobiales bacterium]